MFQKMFSKIAGFKNLNGIEHDNIIDEFKQWYSKRIGDDDDADRSSKSLREIHKGICMHVTCKHVLQGNIFKLIRNIINCHQKWMDDCLVSYSCAISVLY